MLVVVSRKVDGTSTDTSEKKILIHLGLEKLLEASCWTKLLDKLLEASNASSSSTKLLEASENIRNELYKVS